jgi:16S rRNA (guanine1207-N2)-methyltransferase
MNFSDDVSPAHYFTPRAPLEHDAPDDENTRRRDEKIGGVTLSFLTSGGVFARAGLDDGTRLLLENARLADDARVLDLGCGWGAVGCFVAARAPQSRVVMCDINGVAVQVAVRNAQSNTLQNVAAFCGDGASPLRDESFEAVLCNPPVRAGNAVIAKLFDDALRVLASGGALWIVLRTAQGAKSWQKRLRTQFGNCETIAIRGGFRVLCSRKTAGNEHSNR